MNPGSICYKVLAFLMYWRRTMDMWYFCSLILTNFYFYNSSWSGMQAALSSEEQSKEQSNMTHSSLIHDKLLFLGVYDWIT